MCCAYIKSCFEEHMEVKDTEKKYCLQKECFWITQIADDAMFIKNFVMGHSMRLSIFNSFSPL